MKTRTLLSYFIVIFTLFSVSSSAQKKGQSYATIVNSYTIQRFDLDTIRNILFELKGDAQIFTSKYTDLSVRLRKRWKRKKVKVGFQYNLQYENQEEADLNGIPEDKYSQIKSDLLCKIYAYDFKKKRIYFGVYEYSYMINIELINSKTNDFMEFGQLKIVSNHDAIDNNKAAVRLIDQIIRE
jgi:hypothetical protein